MSHTWLAIARTRVSGTGGSQDIVWSPVALDKEHERVESGEKDRIWFFYM